MIFLRPILLFLIMLGQAYAFNPAGITDRQLDAMIEEAQTSDQKFFGNKKEENNIHLIDEDKASGFALYRTSRPNADDMKMFCDLGITEMLVLSGTADKHEYRFQSACPTLKVVADIQQSTVNPVDEDFLKYFDVWVTKAQKEGRKIAFRCECGCHRTGRLAAYYQMKYQGLSLDQAKDIMTKQGKWMFFYPHIYLQVNALADHIAGRRCRVFPSFFCVRTK